MTVLYYESDIGRLALKEIDGKITNIYFSYEELPEDTEIGETPLLLEAVKQLESYFKGELR